MMTTQRKVSFVMAMLVLLGILVLATRPMFSVQAAPTPEQEPNDNRADAQAIPAIGLDNPVTAAIDEPGDVDWYSFESDGNRSYVIELFDADLGLSNKEGNASGCLGRFDSTTGLYIEVRDATDQLASRCEPLGGGNVNTTVPVSVKVSGTYYIKVQAHSEENTGAYSLRVLPAFDEPGAVWDDTTYEPNNRRINAYEIEVGRTNALTAAVEPRPETLATSIADRDWYRFEGQGNVTYVVEIFDVDRGLVNKAGDATGCAGRFESEAGFALSVYDAAGEELAARCAPRGSGNVHTITSFTPNIDGTYFIRLVPHSHEVAGSYSIRVLPDYKNADPDTAWDATTYEPNNYQVNAYAIEVGHTGALSGTIEERNPDFATARGDTDWYRFAGKNGVTYVVEVFGVERSLVDKEGNGSGCARRFGSEMGFFLAAYDAAGEELADRCEPRGSGNVHTTISFTPDVDGTYFIRLTPHAHEVAGSYNIRVLPAYSDSDATWDAETFEPNNTRFQAYPIESGYDNALTSSIEERNAGFATNRPDRDWYRLEGGEGETYIVELFDVSSTLTRDNVSGENCNGRDASGVGIRVFDTLDTRQRAIAQRCRPASDDDGTIHNMVQFTTQAAGTFYIEVVPNPGEVSGSYNIRVRQPGDRPPGEPTTPVTVTPTVSQTPPTVTPTVTPTTTPTTETRSRCRCAVSWLILVAECRSGGKVADVLSLAQAASDLNLEVFEGVRDEVLSQTEQGQHYLDVYEEHNDEVRDLLIADETLREEAVETLAVWEPHLEALVNDNGGDTTITDEQVQAMNTFLDSLRAAGSDDLKQDLDQERAQLPTNLVDMTMDEAQTEVIGGTQVDPPDGTVYLPLISR